MKKKEGHNPLGVVEKKGAAPAAFKKKGDAPDVSTSGD